VLQVIAIRRACDLFSAAYPGVTETGLWHGGRESSGDLANLL
jgi:hypothetical protein